MAGAKKSHLDLARRIIDLVRYHDFESGHHLPEKWLADQLGVSRSLARSGLELLVTRGVLEFLPRQGFFLRLPASAPQLNLIELPSTAEEEVYRTLTRDRFANRLGEQVTVTQLVRRYGVGRSLIMRILGRMAEEGLIERAPGQNWRFRPALNSPEAYEASYRYRLLIEPAAVLEPGFVPDRPKFRHIRQVHELLLQGEIYTVDIGRLFEVDAEFHDAIGQCSGNIFLADAIRQQNRLRRLSEYESYENRARLKESCEEHLAILDALEQGDCEEAARLMHAHISVSRNVRPRSLYGYLGEEGRRTA